MGCGKKNCDDPKPATKDDCDCGCDKDCGEDCECDKNKEKCDEKDKE